MSPTERTVIDHLEDHPDLPVIMDVLSRLTLVDGSQLAGLAAAWRNDSRTSRWRDLALSPDSPLIMEVLHAFDTITELYADDVAGTSGYLTVPGPVAARGVKAIRDALAAAYAKPVLPPHGYLALARPWIVVMGQDENPADGPDLGPAAATIRRVMAAAGGLANRCHDPDARRAFDDLSALGLSGGDERRDARDAAWSAAVASQRRRTWALLRHTLSQQVARGCASCGHGPDERRDAERAVVVAADGACALLVLDIAAAGAVQFLVEPLSVLVPPPRTPPD